jgi:uncharacterized protein YktB (UPF0637 family)
VILEGCRLTNNQFQTSNLLENNLIDCIERAIESKAAVLLLKREYRQPFEKKLSKEFGSKEEKLFLAAIDTAFNSLTALKSTLRP